MSKKSIQAVIKWSGSKRLLANEIISYFPETFGTYYELFLGGGSVLLTLRPESAVCVDVNASLIDFWNKVKCDPVFLSTHYRKEWNLLQADYMEFTRVRDRYNANPNGEDLHFPLIFCWDTRENDFTFAGANQRREVRGLV